MNIQIKTFKYSDTELGTNQMQMSIFGEKIQIFKYIWIFVSALITGYKKRI